MPMYDYLCERCGPFTLMRPMAECNLGADCLICGRVSARAIVTAPQLSRLSHERRSAAATNERNAHEPRTLSQIKAAHRPGCACCTGKPSGSGSHRRNGAKSFPAKRPWMISH
jgi:putative FmdB family regulatory protein